MANEMIASIGATRTRIETEAASLGGILPAVSVPTMDAPAAGIAESFMQALRGVNDQDREAGEKMAAVDSGRSDDLVGAMLSSQEANLQFSMLMQARNKVVGAMDDLIKLQL
ncbi:MAG TPA: flagellar hook-basal body complex protein FliE [Steroidobacteraceae bacterium]|jgi:flagellar hook-basal body complex protein FliE